LNKNEKVKQYIRKKTHKPTVLRFWVKGGVILLCMFGSFLFLMRSPRLCPLEFSQQPQQVVSEPKVRIDLMVTGSYDGECRRGTKSRWFAPTWWWPTHMMGTLTWGGDC